MALQLGALRDALLEAGASGEKAAKASEEVAVYEQQLAEVRRDLYLLKWMVGTNAAMTLAVLARVWLYH